MFGFIFFSKNAVLKLFKILSDHCDVFKRKIFIDEK